MYCQSSKFKLKIKDHLEEMTKNVNADDDYYWA